MHPSCVFFLFFHAVLSKLSSSPTTLDRHVTIYLQREQSFSRHLSANNVKEHTGGRLCLCPLSQEFACTVMTQRSVLSHPWAAASFSKRNHLLSASLHPEAVQPRAVPMLSPSVPLFASAESNSSKTEKRSFNSSTLPTREVSQAKYRFFPKDVCERSSTGHKTHTSVKRL